MLETVKENLMFVLEFGLVILCMFVVAIIFDRLAARKRGTADDVSKVRKMTVTGMFSAIAAILMLAEFPLFFAPPFYELDFSELPILIGAFAFGPVAGVTMEFVKILLNTILTGTTTAFVGELANFVVGCSFILPASIIYLFKKSKKTALVGSITGTLVMTVFGTAFNAIYLLPKFAQLYGMPLEVIIGMGTEINPYITNISSFVIMAVAPLNLIKGSVVSGFTMAVYKKLSPILKADGYQMKTKSSVNA